MARARRARRARTSASPRTPARSSPERVLGIEDYFHYILSSQSDPMLVTFLLAALDMGLLGRYRWALVFAVLTGLGRPEVWPFLGLFMLWCWFKVPRMRWMVIAGVILIGFMWFGIPTITNGRPDIAGQLAKGSPRELKSNQLVGTIKRFHEMQYLPVWIAAALAVLLAALTQPDRAPALGVGVVAWSDLSRDRVRLPRWLAPAGAATCSRPLGRSRAPAGVAVGWLLGDLPRIVRGAPAWAGAVLAAVLIAAMIPRRDLPRARRSTRTSPTSMPGRTRSRCFRALTTRFGGTHHGSMWSAGHRRGLRELAGLALPLGRRLGRRSPTGGVEGGELRNPAIPKKAAELGRLER